MGGDLEGQRRTVLHIRGGERSMVTPPNIFHFGKTLYCYRPPRVCSTVKLLVQFQAMYVANLARKIWFASRMIPPKTKTKQKQTQGQVSAYDKYSCSFCWHRITSHSLRVSSMNLWLIVITVSTTITKTGSSSGCWDFVYDELNITRVSDSQSIVRKASKNVKTLMPELQCHSWDACTLHKVDDTVCNCIDPGGHDIEP